MIVWLVHDFGITGDSYIELPQSNPPASESSIRGTNSGSKIVRRPISGGRATTTTGPPPAQRFPAAT